MIRVLHVVSTMDYGGVETLLMSVYRKIDRNLIQFDFLCHNRLESAFHDEILSMGGRMYMVNGPHHGGFINYIHELKEFYNNHHEYSIVHAHMNRDNAWALWQAKKANIPVRISHNHVARKQYSFPYSLYVQVAKKVNSHCLTHCFACSKDAGEELFGKNTDFYIIPNAIDTSKFVYDNKLRKIQRDKWKLDNDILLIGHVGRFDEPKNHHFILHIFSVLAKQNTHVKLILIGSGPMEEKIVDEAQQLGLKEKVIFAGQHRNLQAMYAAMDAFIFPSLYEGLGIVAVEAQCSGLPVLASDFVPKEAAVTDRIMFLSLDSSLEKWAEQIEKLAKNSRDDREIYREIVKNSPYEIEHTVTKLSQFYTKNSLEAQKK